MSQIKVAPWQQCYCLTVMSYPNRTLAAALACAAHAGTAAERVVKRFSEASTDTASCVVLRPRLDAQ